MKNVVTGIMMSIMMSLFIIIILTTDDRIIRINEVNTALADALDESINVLDMDKYSITDTDELIADVTQGLLMQIESDAEVTVNVMDADKDKGIVTVEAVENFRKASGAAGQTAATRTIILEKSRYSIPMMRITNSLISHILIQMEQNTSLIVLRKMNN